MAAVCAWSPEGCFRLQLPPSNPTHMHTPHVGWMPPNTSSYALQITWHHVPMAQLCCMLLPVRCEGAACAPAVSKWGRCQWGGVCGSVGCNLLLVCYANSSVTPDTPGAGCVCVLGLEGRGPGAAAHVPPPPFPAHTPPAACWQGLLYLTTQAREGGPGPLLLAVVTTWGPPMADRGQLQP